MRSLTAALVALMWFVAGAERAQAVSSAFWSPCTIAVQPAGTANASWSSLWSAWHDSGPSSSGDFEITWGVGVGPQLVAEVSLDALVPGQYPWYFSAKVGYPEKTLSPHAPALQFGFYGFGTQPDLTNYNVVYLVTGATLPDGKTQVAVAGWIGNGAALSSSTGERQNHGYMAALQYQLSAPATLVADYESGRNALGGGGIGVNYSFSKDLSLLTGPVWFNDRGISGGMKWMTQWSLSF